MAWEVFNSLCSVWSIFLTTWLKFGSVLLVPVKWLAGKTISEITYTLVRVPVMTLPGYFWDRWPSLAGKLSWDVTTTQVNSVLHLSGITKWSTSFSWGKGGKATDARWQVLWFHMACDFPLRCGNCDYELLYPCLLYLVGHYSLSCSLLHQVNSYFPARPNHC